MTTKSKSLIQIFSWPIVMGVLTMIGLVIALLLEGGLLELVAIAALAVPVIVMIYFYVFRDVTHR